MSVWKFVASSLLCWKICSVSSTKHPTLPIATCVAKATSPEVNAFSISFACQLAAFGSYLQSESDNMPIVLAPESMLACSSLGAPFKYEGSIVLVRRGDCSFQDKLGFVEKAGAKAMILVNTEDKLIPLSSLEYEHNNAVAASVTKTDGKQLIEFVEHHRRGLKEIGSLSSIVLEIKAPIGLVFQARARLEFLTHINAPILVYEEFQDIVELLSLGTLDELLKSIATANDDGINSLRSDVDVNNLVELFSWSTTQLSKWEFASETALYASVAAAVLQLSREMKTADQIGYRVLQVAAGNSAEAGYYKRSSILLEMILAASGTNYEVQCQLAFMKFLQGDVLASLNEAHVCTTANLNERLKSLQVARATFARLSGLTLSEKDHSCLQHAVGVDILSSDAKQYQCCSLAEGSSTSTPLRQFSSAFTEELFHASVMMGVFLDELGPFTESLRFFKLASRLCGSDFTNLQLRQLLAVPVIFGSQQEMNSFVEDFHNNLKVFIEKGEQPREVVIDPLRSVGEREGESSTLAIRPEASAYLQYTITPPTMLVGYQGINVLPIQKAVNKLRTLTYPSLASSFTPTFLDRTRTQSSDSELRRIGFISAWFRSHSVGKLLLGVVQNLDRSKFHVQIYRCVHFLRDADEITDKFKQTADEYFELPETEDDAVKILRQARLDVVVYPELGMDEWTVLLSHHRVAPVQCVFWGHPITTGNPHIDYFISSEHFVSDHFDDQTETFSIPIEGQDEVKLSGYRRSHFSEQVMLFRGLGTIFTRPAPLAEEAKGISRSMLHLPANRRLYVCPQTLMKLHPVFDKALAGILENDDQATIVLLASETQKVWMEKLRRRFRRRFGQGHRRVLFLPTLPFSEFQALLSQADVLLDPFPFGGGVTTLDALHLGIPVVTLPAAQSVVHLAAGFLRYVNASDCIANSLDEYISLAIKIAKDSRDIRSRLLLHRNDIYEDTSSVNDWNEFLRTVTTRMVAEDSNCWIQHSQQGASGLPPVCKNKL